MAQMTLSFAKEVAKTDKIFLAGDDRFSIFDGGKYASGATFIVPTEWGYDRNGKLRSPVIFRRFDEYIGEMNLDFNANSVEVIFGKYRVSKTGNPVLEICPPNRASHVMAAAYWGGCFSDHHGTSENPDPDHIPYFRRARSNGGGLGTDYYVLSVGYVYGRPNRDVSEILETITKEIHMEELNYEQIFLHHEQEKRELEEKQSIAEAYREDFLDSLAPYIEKLHEAEEAFHGGKDYSSLLEIYEHYLSLFGRIYFSPENQEKAEYDIQTATISFWQMVKIEDAIRKYYDSCRPLKEYCTLRFEKCRNSMEIIIETTSPLCRHEGYVEYRKSLYAHNVIDGTALREVQDFVSKYRPLWERLDNRTKSEEEQALAHVTDNVDRFSVDQLRALKEVIDNALENKGALT